MNLLSHIVHAFIFTAINGYILFAANIDDFKIIAKKYMPDVFADKLAKIAAETALVRQDDAANNNNNTAVVLNGEEDQKEIARTAAPLQSETENEQQDTEISDIVTPTEKPFDVDDKNKKPALAGIDIDVLVEKIKERLDKQYLEKYKNYVVSTPSLVPQTTEASQMPYKVTEAENVKLRDSLRKPDQPEYEYEMVSEGQPMVQPLMQTQHQGAGNIEFDEKDLTNTKDSYEEYQIPPKYEVRDKTNLQTEKTTRKVPTLKDLKNYVPKKHLKMHNYEEIKWDDNERYDNDPNEDEREKLKSEEIKARTENMNFDYQSYKVTEETSPYYNRKKVSVRGTKGTGIPIRERYTLSSPNYYASIPIVVEKYDFNEPLPEKDREPEDLKYFGNQPAKINKKVAL